MNKVFTHNTNYFEGNKLDLVSSQQCWRWSKHIQLQLPVLFGVKFCTEEDLHTIQNVISNDKRTLSYGTKIAYQATTVFAVCSDMLDNCNWGSRNVL
jgi:hypothetical protein